MQLVKRSALARWRVRVLGLNEFAPGYLMGALFDPYLARPCEKNVVLHLNLASRDGEADDLPGLEIAGIYGPQKERIVFSSARAGTRALHLPFPYARVGASSDWNVPATCAELPGVLTAPGLAAFMFDPIQLITKYLDMAEPDITADVIDLIVRAVLAARGEPRDLDADELRRDFHALGISYMMVEELYALFGAEFDAGSLFAGLYEAAEAYRQGDSGRAREELIACFQTLTKAREQLFPEPIYIMDMPHGGILFEEEGYAEYDWPEAAAKILRLYLEWSQGLGYRFAPDIGAGTLKHLNATHPKTVLALKRAWDEKRIEFVNGTYSQPYLQLWDMWSQHKQFEEGLRVFDELFGQRPTVYAAQEIALHPALPGMLRQYGYEAAIHRSQNQGTAPLDDSPLIDWEGPDGATIPTLPSHAPRSEKLGSGIYRGMPVLIKGTADAKLPFAAITNLIDQTFVGAYKEEVIRTARLCGLWGEFLTPSEFFKKTAHVPRVARRYSLDVYDYDREMPSANYHRYESGGFSSLLELWLQTARRLEDDERRGSLQTPELHKLLDGQSHDGYVVSYFKRGAFLDLYLTDYVGPRYKVTGDNPRGVDHYLRDCLGAPEVVSAELPVSLGRAEIDGAALALDDVHFRIDPETAHVCEINGRAVRLGAPRYGQNPLNVQGLGAREGRLVIEGVLRGFGDLRLVYGIAGETLYCLVEADPASRRSDCKTPYWEDCVYLAHALPEATVVHRHCSGCIEPTALPDFYSAGHIVLKAEEVALTLGHGGNGFFKRSGAELWNRLWAYNENSRSFWWSVSLKHHE